jgi:hypothetical protein
MSACDRAKQRWSGRISKLLHGDTTPLYQEVQIASEIACAHCDLPDGRMAKLAPEELRRRQLAVLVAWILAGARSQATALAFEDLHWADPTTLDLMGALAERGAQAPLFIIATARTEFRSPWSLRPHHSVIALAPLDRAQVARIVGEISSRQALSEEVVEWVSERTGGVPLFVEEVTRLLLESGTQAIRQPCSSRSRRGSTGLAKRAGSRRPARFWGAIFLMRCSALLPGSL